MVCKFVAQESLWPDINHSGTHIETNKCAEVLVVHRNYFIWYVITAEGSSDSWLSKPMVIFFFLKPCLYFFKHKRELCCCWPILLCGVHCYHSPSRAGGLHWQWRSLGVEASLSGGSTSNYGVIGEVDKLKIRLRRAPTFWLMEIVVKWVKEDSFRGKHLRPLLTRTQILGLISPLQLPSPWRP